MTGAVETQRSHHRDPRAVPVTGEPMFHTIQLTQLYIFIFLIGSYVLVFFLNMLSRKCYILVA